MVHSVISQQAPSPEQGLGAHEEAPSQRSVHADMSVRAQVPAPVLQRAPVGSGGGQGLGAQEVEPSQTSKQADAFLSTHSPVTTLQQAPIGSQGSGSQAAASNHAPEHSEIGRTVHRLEFGSQQAPRGSHGSGWQEGAPFQIPARHSERSMTVHVEAVASQQAPIGSQISGVQAAEPSQNPLQVDGVRISQARVAESQQAPGTSGQIVPAEPVV